MGKEKVVVVEEERRGSPCLRYSTPIPTAAELSPTRSPRSELFLPVETVKVFGFEA